MLDLVQVWDERKCRIQFRFRTREGVGFSSGLTRENVLDLVQV